MICLTYIKNRCDFPDEKIITFFTNIEQHLKLRFIFTTNEQQKTKIR